MASPTRYVVGALIGAFMAVGLVYALTPGWGWLGTLAVVAILSYEGWTLVNRWPNDTISEVVWELAKRPMVPYLFGAGSGWALATGAFPNAYAVAAFFFLMGHFFFQRQESR